MWSIEKASATRSSRASHSFPTRPTTVHTSPLNAAVGLLTLPIRPAAVAIEGIGLGGDIALDGVKNLVLHNNEPLDDEGHRGPLFGTETGFGGPIVYLPGWGPKGVDWSF